MYTHYRTWSGEHLNETTTDTLTARLFTTTGKTEPMTHRNRAGANKNLVITPESSYTDNKASAIDPKPELTSLIKLSNSLSCLKVYRSLLSGLLYRLSF